MVVAGAVQVRTSFAESFLRVCNEPRPFLRLTKMVSSFQLVAQRVGGGLPSQVSQV